mmetsp:Transcript_42895/g.136320  ORF Transcript_42895/g.136320 Transcript_42895/m.136320 type:complete len:248 (-) Transcript_42895:352-1095(-)
MLCRRATCFSSSPTAAIVIRARLGAACLDAAEDVLQDVKAQGLRQQARIAQHCFEARDAHDPCCWGSQSERRMLAVGLVCIELEDHAEQLLLLSYATADIWVLLDARKFVLGAHAGMSEVTPEDFPEAPRDARPRQPQIGLLLFPEESHAQQPCEEAKLVKPLLLTGGRALMQQLVVERLSCVRREVHASAVQAAVSVQPHDARKRDQKMPPAEADAVKGKHPGYELRLRANQVPDRGSKNAHWLPD